MHHLILLHGMGDEDPADYYAPFQERLRNVLRKKGADPDKTVTFSTIDYSHVARDEKWEVFRRSFPSYGPGRPSLLRPIPFMHYFVTLYIGDVIVYASSEGENIIRTFVFNELDAIIDQSPRVSIVAHSLGSIIAYDYLYNVFGRPALERRAVRSDGQQSLGNFFSMGSPIGLFLLRKLPLLRARSPLLVNPIGLDRTRGRWYNFFDRQDILAYPLARFFPGIVEDRDVQTGNLVYNSHVNYWKNREVVDTIAGQLLQSTEVT